MLIEGKDITSYQLLLIKQESVLFKFKYLLLWLVNLEFFFNFSKQWVGQTMAKETFYWDGLMESGIQGFGIRNTAKGILNPTRD